jgi:hypothetical protein
VSDVWQAGGSQHGIGDGMAEDIGIRMTVQSERVRDFYPSEHEFSAFDEAMHIITDTGADHGTTGVGERVSGGAVGS